MNLSETKMNRLSIRLGYWSALACVITFIVWIVCFTAILVVNPLFTWTNLPDYVAYTAKSNQFFKHFAEFAMIVFAVSFVVLLNAIQDYARDEKKILARIGSHFGLGFAILIGINYFVQLSAVPLSIGKGQLDGLAQFIQSNPTSGIAAINLLGWSVFLGLCSLFIAPVFSGGKIENVIKYAFLANGIICLLGGIGYVFDNILLVFLTMDLGMGGALLVATIALTVWFRRMSE